VAGIEAAQLAADQHRLLRADREGGAFRGIGGEPEQCRRPVSAGHPPRSGRCSARPRCPCSSVRLSASWRVRRRARQRRRSERLGSPGSAASAGQGGEARAPELQTLGRGRRRRRFLSGLRQAAFGDRNAAVLFLDEAAIAQLLTAGVEVAAARFQSGERRRLSPGEAPGRMLGERSQQLPCLRVQARPARRRAGPLFRSGCSASACSGPLLAGLASPPNWAMRATCASRSCSCRSLDRRASTFASSAAIRTVAWSSALCSSATRWLSRLAPPGGLSAGSAEPSAAASAARSTLATAIAGSGA
jgi:hypothetical protein